MKNMKIGDRASITKTISDDSIRICAELMGDYNPLHLDDEFAIQTRFGRRIAHGVLPMGLISAVLGTKLPGAGTIYLSQEINFLAPVYPGDEITATVEIIKIKKDKGLVTLRTRCCNQNGIWLIEGNAVVLVEKNVHHACI